MTSDRGDRRKSENKRHKSVDAAGNEEGNIAIMGALFMPAAIGLLALGVDLGAVYLEDRELQNVADLAAIAGASQVMSAEQLATQTAKDNGFDGFIYTSNIPGSTYAGAPGDTTDAPSMTLQLGRYTRDAAIAPSQRFVPGASNANAVRVTLQRPASLHFASMFRDEPPVVETAGVAYAATEAAFTVGSRLASLNDGLLNDVLGQLLGANLSLSVMDYDSLLDTHVQLFAFLDALATEVGVTAGTYDDVLLANATVADVLDAAATAGGAPTATLLATIADDRDVANLGIDLTRLISLGTLGDIGIGQGDSAMDAQIGLMELLTAAAGIANGSSQVDLDIGVTVPGLAGVSAALVIGEPPQGSGWFAAGEQGTMVRTAQTRLYVEATIGGRGALAGIAVRLPVFVEVAYAEAKIDSVSCPYGNAALASVDMGVRPGIVEARIADLSGDLKDFGDNQNFRPARLVDITALKITGQAHAEMGNQRFRSVRFDYNDIRNMKTKTVSTSNYTSSLVGSLLGDLDVNIQLVGLSLLSLNSLSSAVAATLAPAATPLDGVIYNLASGLGLSVGEADVSVTGVRCQRSVLVQ